MAETPKRPGAGCGDHSIERDGDPDPPRAASGPADQRAGGSDVTVMASARLPEFDQSSAIALAKVGRRWDGCMPAREIWERALPVDPGLAFADPERSRAGRFVHIRTAGATRADDDELEATVRAGAERFADRPGGVRVAWGLLAGARLIVDYILTVAVSVAAGVAAVTSAIPSVASATVPIGLVVIVLLVAGNLRGVRDSAVAFASPTYLFASLIAYEGIIITTVPFHLSQ
jgi:amino acid transporter